jgi:tripartite-type tricarboxylate transporter receptor subunit TctC
MPGLGRAQSGWPDRPLRFVIGGAAGGVSDIFLRMMENRLRERLGQPLIIDPRPGAGGMVGAEITARAAPDGYTYYVNHIASHGIGPTLYRRLAFDPLKDLPGVARLAALPNVLIVKGDGPVKTVEELVAFCRANPARANFSSAGSGTSSHLSGLLFGMRMGIEVTHVPYRGTGAALPDVLNGTVQAMIQAMATAAPLVAAGQMRVIGVAAEQRLPAMPDVPTLREQGVDLVAGFWWGVLGPAGIPAPIVARLQEAIDKSMASDSVQARLPALGLERLQLGPDAFRTMLVNETARWRDVVQTAGIKPE